MRRPLVAALAGRRVDAADAPEPRFPMRNAVLVRERIRELLARRGAAAIVSSAACGADLLALDVAGELRLRRVVVLPFSPERFRSESVTDRPGGTEQWGPAFDRVMQELPRDDLIVLGRDDEGTAAFAAANERIIEESQRLAGIARGDVIAVVVWDGAPRGGDDLTAHFAHVARARGIGDIEEVPTQRSPTDA